MVNPALTWPALVGTLLLITNGRKAGEAGVTGERVLRCPGPARAAQARATQPDAILGDAVRRKPVLREASLSSTALGVTTCWDAIESGPAAPVTALRGISLIGAALTGPSLTGTIATGLTRSARSSGTLEAGHRAILIAASRSVLVAAWRVGLISAGVLICAAGIGLPPDRTWVARCGRVGGRRAVHRALGRVLG